MPRSNVESTGSGTAFVTGLRNGSSYRRFRPCRHHAGEWHRLSGDGLCAEEDRSCRSVDQPRLPRAGARPNDQSDRLRDAADLAGPFRRAGRYFRRSAASSHVDRNRRGRGGGGALSGIWTSSALTELLANRDDHIESAARDTDTAVVMFTSGTTGVSKGCLLSHRYAVRTAENMIGPFRITADDVAYTPYPSSHIGPAFYDILPTLMTGGRVVVRDGFSLSNFWPEMVRFGVTWFMCLGSVQQLLCRAAMPGRAPAQGHPLLGHAGAGAQEADFDARFGLHLVPGGGYGSTDAGWVVVPQWDHPGGIVLPHYEVAIVDENDDPLPPHHDGEMVIRPREPGVMADGYFGMPDKTSGNNPESVVPHRRHRQDG